MCKPSPKRRHGASKDSCSCPTGRDWTDWSGRFLLRFAAFANRQVELIRESDSLTFRVVDCRVQSARKRKGMPLHPCLSVGIREYAFFAKTIDDRIVCEPVSCFPRVSDPGCACSWRFTMGNPGNGPEEAPDDNGQGKV